MGIFASLAARQEGRGAACGSLGEFTVQVEGQSATGVRGTGVVPASDEPHGYAQESNGYRLLDADVTLAALNPSSDIDETGE